MRRFVLLAACLTVAMFSMTGCQTGQSLMNLDNFNAGNGIESYRTADAQSARPGRYLSDRPVATGCNHGGST